MNDQNIIDRVLKNLDINPKTFYLRSLNENIKDECKKEQMMLLIKEYSELTFVVNNKIFWGQDRQHLH